MSLPLPLPLPVPVPVPRDIITELTIKQLQALQSALQGNQVLIIKFGAEWCGPCKRIAPAYQAFSQTCSANIICADIDVDDSIELYLSLKRAKMVSSIPVFLAFFGGVKRDMWYIPDDSVIGADPLAVDKFFQRCTAFTAANYTYFT